MNKVFAFRASLMSLLVVGVVAPYGAMAADAASAVVGKAVSKKADVVVAKPAAVGKVVVKAGTAVGKSDDNQYPTGSPVIPPKPKKEGLEAVGAIKANVAKP